MLTRLYIFFFALVLCISVEASHNAYGLVKVNLGTGFGQNAKLTFQDKDLEKFNPELASSHITLSVLASPPIPTPFVDIGLGLTGGVDWYDFAKVKYHMSNEDDEPRAYFDKITSYFVGPELVVSGEIPAVPVSPRLRLAYTGSLQTLGGTIRDDNSSKEFEISLHGHGPRGGIGIEVSPLPLLAIFVEYELGLEFVSISKKIPNDIIGAVNRTKFFKNVDGENFKDSGYNSLRQGFVVGAQVGF